MLNAVCAAALLLVAAAVPGGLVVEPAEAVPSGWVLLREIPLDELAVGEDFFVLAFNPALGEAFERYVFVIVGDDMPGVAVIRVLLIDGILGLDQVVCAGPLVELPVLPVHMNCYDIMPGHHYRIDSFNTFPSILQLYGYDPII